MRAAAAQLSLDGADRLVAQLAERRAPVAMSEAAASLFALRGQPPSALVHQLVDEVVRADGRLVWRSPTEVALAEWEEVASLHDVPIDQAPFVVFDLETTGTRPGVSRIVEIGAVRLQGFEQVGLHEQLVNPGVPVPATITAITGIETRDVRRSPRIAQALPRFLAFAQGAVLVAHNARFDVGFVDAELSRLEGRRLAAPVLDTVALARRLLEGRLPRMNLGTLAERFDTEVRPCHRALPDAQATAEVLVQLLGMAQEHGVTTVAEAVAFAAPVRRRVRLRRELARDVPAGPGVYLFHDRDDRVLYVGKATDLRARVRSYFAGSELRKRVEHALEATERIETRPLGSEFEAALLEIELILRLRPDANRRSAHPERSCYLTLTTDERVPRLSVTARPHPGAVSVGPLRSRGQAQAAAAAVRQAFRLRTCRPALPEDDGSCLAGLLGRCAAPCRGGDSAADHDAAVAAAAAWLAGGPDGGAVAAMRARMAALGAERRFEQAAEIRDGLDALESVWTALARVRRAVQRSGVVLAADLDDRFVQAFACAGGRVVARRRLPRAGDAVLEAAPLVASLGAALDGPAPPLEPGQADVAHVVAAALARPGRDLATVAVRPGDIDGVVRRIAAARERVPCRR
ncbi:MAG TPA: exonuclease domain-containing protein [Gaiellales bacterium]